MRSELFFAVVTLGVLFDKLYYFGLLYFYSLVYYSYEVYFDANSFAVRLSPHELGLFDLHLAQAFHLLQQDGQELCTFSLAVDPRRPFVSSAVSAKELFLSRGK